MAGLGSAASAAARAQATMDAYHGAFLTPVAFALLGIIVTLFIRDSDAAASMRSPTATPRKSTQHMRRNLPRSVARTSGAGR